MRRLSLVPSSALVLLLWSLARVESAPNNLSDSRRARLLWPYISCTGCDYFLECFFKCPKADYPGLNRFGIYESQNKRTDGPRASVEHNYDNWRPFDPSEYAYKYHRRRHQPLAASQQQQRYRRSRKS